MSQALSLILPSSIGVRLRKVLVETRVAGNGCGCGNRACSHADSKNPYFGGEYGSLISMTQVELLESSFISRSLLRSRVHHVPYTGITSGSPEPLTMTTAHRNSTKIGPTGLT